MTTLSHSPARPSAATGHHSPHGITGASPELAKPAPADDAATGGRGLSQNCNDAHRLRAARQIFGRPSTKPHGSR